MKPIDTTTGAPVETYILNLHAKLLLGKATQEEIEQVTELARKNGCLEKLRESFSTISEALFGDGTLM